MILGNFTYLLVAGDLALIKVGDWIRIALNGIEITGLGRVAFLNPLLEVVEDVYFGVAEDTKCPANTWRTEDTELVVVVDNDGVVLADAQGAHGLGELLGGREHVRVGRVLVLDLVEIEEAGLGDALLVEGLDAGAGIIGQKPGGTEGDDAGIGADGGGRTRLEGLSKLLGRHEIGREVSTGGHVGDLVFSEEMPRKGSSRGGEDVDGRHGWQGVECRTNKDESGSRRVLLAVSVLQCRCCNIACAGARVSATRRRTTMQGVRDWTKLETGLDSEEQKARGTVKKEISPRVRGVEARHLGSFYVNRL